MPQGFTRLVSRLVATEVMSEVRYVMSTFCAEAGRLNAAIANSDNAAIQAGLNVASGFLVLIIGFSSISQS